ncbi:conserved protein, unknown function [Hepatocystis sp. ex Piliocolobus tephrosceles]|nr:conserved protein, unknown function [Hepatocystis sp. ex Piliocolobus tephrosceles]
MHLFYLSTCFWLCLLQLCAVKNKKPLITHTHLHIIPVKNDINVLKKHNIFWRKLNFIFSKKKKEKYVIKNLEAIPLFVITNEFDQVIISFNLDYNKNESKKKHIILNNNELNISKSESNNVSDRKSNNDSSDSDSDVLVQHDNNLLFSTITYKEERKKEINLNKIHDNNCISIFFLDSKTAEAYKDDILHLYNKNLKEKKNDKLFFGSKVKNTNLKHFLKIKKVYNDKIDFVLVPNYNELQHVLKNKKIFYGTPIYYINKIKLQKSVIKQKFYQLFFRNQLAKQIKMEIYPGIYMTYTIEEEEQENAKEREIEKSKTINHNKGHKQNDEQYYDKQDGQKKDSFLIIQLKADDGKKYIPIFFSYEDAHNFYNLFLKHFSNNFFQYCLPKPYIALNSFENLLRLLKMANNNKIQNFHNLFFIPTSDSYFDKLDSNETNYFVFYAKKIYQKINYDLFRSFRKNLNYLISDYLYK